MENQEAEQLPKKVTLVIPEEVTQNLREYVDICTQIKTAKDELKIFSERKSELEEFILEFMMQNSIPAFDTPNGRIKLCETKSKAPLNKDYLREMVSKKLTSQETDEIIELAFDKRPTVNSQKIKLGPNMK